MESFSCAIKGSVLVLNGKVNVDSLGKIMKNDAFNVSETISDIDCANITHADSSCLAFLLYLQEKYQSVAFVNLPKHLLLLVDLYDLDNTLNLRR